MRAMTLIIVTLATMASWCQQAPVFKTSVSDLPAKLHSKDWTERSDAVDQIRSDPAALRSRRVQGALIDLLEQENQERDQGLREAQKPNIQKTQAGNGTPNGDGEGFGEYVAWLTE